MNQRVLASAMVLVTLVACSAKQVPPAGSGDVGGQNPPESTVAQAAAPGRSPVDLAAGMMTLIDPSPQCQSYRDQLQAAANGPPGDATGNRMAMIVQAAHEAGCSRKPGAP